MILTPGSRILSDYRDKVYSTDLIGGTLAAISPHTATERFYLNITTGDRAVLEHVYLEIIRSGAATTLGVATAQLRINETGVYTFIQGRAVLRSNTVGETDRVVIPCSILLLPGYTVSLWTSDSSTGGTCDYIITAILHHFRR